MPAREAGERLSSSLAMMQFVSYRSIPRLAYVHNTRSVIGVLQQTMRTRTE